MSPVTAVLEREEQLVAPSVPQARKANTTPQDLNGHELRRWLRDEVTRLNGNPGEIESIRGDCFDQTNQQVHDLRQWLAGR